MSSYDLCVTGEGLSRLTYDSQLLKALLPHVRVFARVSPKQKVISQKFLFVVTDEAMIQEWLGTNQSCLSVGSQSAL